VRRNLEKTLFEGAERNRKTAEDMIVSNYRNWGLFVYHLALEKILKGILAQQNKDIPLIHNLARLGQQTEIEFTEEQYKQLDEITTFNLEARYDDYKYQFYKKVTPKFTKEWVKNAQRLYTWIKKHKK